MFGESLMSEAKVRDRVLDAVRNLPDDATVEDAMERLYFLSMDFTGTGSIFSFRAASSRAFASARSVLLPSL